MSLSDEHRKAQADHNRRRSEDLQKMSKPMVFKDCTFTMSEPQFNDEIGILYHSQASSTFESTGASILPGDAFTMEVTPRLGWWGRLAVRLGLRAKPEPALREFKITAVHSNGRTTQVETGLDGASDWVSVR